MRIALRLMIFSACAVAAGGVLAQTLYKWVDAQGVVHYSEQPPPSGKASKFDVRAGATQAVETKPAAASSSSFAADEKSFRSAACESAKRDLAVLASGAMVVGGGSLGKPADVEQATKLTAEQREAARAQASKRVHDYCGQG